MDTLIGWIVGKVKDYVLRNWKTTLVGIVGGALTQVPALAPHKDLIVATILALLGVVAKDGDKTGTTASSASPLKVIVPESDPVAFPDRRADAGG